MREKGEQEQLSEQRHGESPEKAQANTDADLEAGRYKGLRRVP